MSKGIDMAIDSLITDLSATLWTGADCQFYGRIFRSLVGGLIQPLYYSGTEAIEVLRTDLRDAQCFVDVESTRKMYTDVIEAECRVCFMVNLLACFPTLNRSEAIEQAMADVKDLLMSSEFEIIQMVSGPDAFSDYKWSEDSVLDLQSNHLFRFDIKLIYANF